MWEQFKRAIRGQQSQAETGNIKQIKRSALVKVRDIGEGGFSDVYEMTWKSPNGRINVAAKKLHKKDTHELEILSDIHHPNIIKLIGVVDEGTEFMLILELCEGGSLRSYLEDRNGMKLTETQFYDWAEQATKPLEYLHARHLVHKDVKSPNYLISSQNTLKLCDFDIAKNIDGTVEDATTRASLRWMAPELLVKFVLSPKYDIFALAVVLWELWTVSYPWEGINGPTIIYKVCQENKRLPMPEHCPEPIKELLTQCWQTDWKQRPDSTKVLQVITSLSRAAAAPEHTPVEILAQGPDALFAYRNAIKNGKKAVYRTRVMFVGQERVGKTSLRKKMMGEKFDSQEISTDGIEASSRCRVDIHQTTTSWTADQHTNDQHDAYTSAIAEHMAKDLMIEKRKHTDGDNDDGDHDDILQSKSLIDTIEQQDEEVLSKRDNDQHTDEDDDKLQSKSRRSTFEATQIDIDSYGKTKTSLESIVPDDVKEAFAGKLSDIKDRDQDDKGITFSLWDFAGQELYYTTHQVFLSRRTLFIVVVNLEDDFSEIIPSALNRLEFWLKSIHTFTYAELTHTAPEDDCDQLSPPIFIVGTHRNSLAGTKEGRQRLVDSKFHSIRERIAGKPYIEHIVPEYFAVENSLAEDERISDLKRKVMQVMEQEPYMGEEIPLRWLKFEDSVKDSVNEGHNTMTIDKVKQLPGANGVESPTELTTMLTFYHELGAIMYHPTANHSLKELVILNPHWLIEVFRRIITILDPKERRGRDSKSWTRLDKEGILEDKLISSVWKEFIGNDKQSNTKKSALLELMEMYDLLVEQCLPEKKQHQKMRCYYVPSTLKKTDDDTMDRTSDDESPTKVEFYVDFSGFLPVGFFHRMLARAVQWSQTQGGFSPRLLYNKATLFADNYHNFQIEIMANMTSIMKVTIYPVEVLDDKAASRVSRDVDKNTFHEVTKFLAATLEDLKNTWARGITYKICFKCPCKKGSLHFLDLDKYLTGQAGIQICIYGSRVENNHFDKQFSSQCDMPRNKDQKKTNVDQLNRVKRVLTGSIRIVCDNLHSKELLRIMVSEGALTADDMARIEKKGIASDQAECMLTILMKKPVHSYDVFMDALLKIGRKDIYTSIKVIEKEVENST